MSTATLSGVISEPLPDELDRIFREHYQLVYRTAYGVIVSADRLKNNREGGKLNSRFGRVADRLSWQEQLPLLQHL